MKCRASIAARPALHGATGRRPRRSARADDRAVRRDDPHSPARAQAAIYRAENVR